MPKVVASVEARMSSSRLPGKVLKDIGGKPALNRVIERIKACHFIDDIVLATSTNSSDDVLEEWAKAHSVSVFRGDEENVLERVVGAHHMMKSTHIVEVTGDCPLLDPEVIDLGVETFFKNNCDVVTNTRVPSFPQGADIQVFRYSDLSKIAGFCLDPVVQEHVSLYFYENPSLYKIVHMLAPRHWKNETVRLQLDYPEDLDFIRQVYAFLEPKYGSVFGISEILNLLRAHPELTEINRHCEEKPLR